MRDKLSPTKFPAFKFIKIFFSTNLVRTVTDMGISPVFLPAYQNRRPALIKLKIYGNS